jgi:aconitate hydratase
MERAAHVARQAAAQGVKSKSYLLISPGSEQVYQTILRDGQMQVLNDAGAVVLTNSCGPCIGNWDRSDIVAGQQNSIVSSFNRNFPKRNDGNAETLSFITSPEIVMAFALSGSLSFNPLTDKLNGVLLKPPVAPELPPNGFALSAAGFVEAPANGKSVEVEILPTSTRLEKLQPFTKWNGQDYMGVPVLVKTKGQTTTDHISPAGKDWLPLRGHLSGIAHNMLLGAVDAETGQPAPAVKMNVCGVERGASPWALKAIEYRDQGIGSIIVGDENYGEGSSREHAAMCPRLLGVKAVIVKSFARIHETNLKKQGIIPLTFSSASDYDKIHKGDKLDIINLSQIAAGKPVECVIHSQDGSTATISLNHSMSTEQITWFKAGSAMNAVNQPVTA